MNQGFLFMYVVLLIVVCWFAWLALLFLWTWIARLFGWEGEPWSRDRKSSD